LADISDYLETALKEGDLLRLILKSRVDLARFPERDDL
jgi:hypothetical protein